MINRYGLFRDPARGWIAGVAAGLAERFGVNVGVIRLVFAIALLSLHILALVAYVVLAVLMPIRPFLFESRRDRPWRSGY